VKRGGPIARKTRLRPVNHERARRRFEAAYGGSKASWIRSMPCCCGCGTPPQSEAAHTKSRGAGGTAKDLIPLSSLCHRRQHARGWVALGATREHFEKIAASLHERWADERDEKERAA